MNRQLAIFIIVACSTAVWGFAHTASTPGGPMPTEITVKAQAMQPKFTVPMDEIFVSLMQEESTHGAKYMMHPDMISHQQKALQKAYNMGVKQGVKAAGMGLQQYLTQLGEYVTK